MKLTEKQVALLIEIGGGTKEVISRDHPHHHDCIKNAVENAFELLERAQNINRIRQRTLRENMGESIIESGGAKRGKQINTED